MKMLLNDEQRRAVETVKGRLLILAGAGSGKTRVLTYRMAHLINTLKVPPKAILGLTFTNKAAAEMRHRLGALVDGSVAKHVTLATFHSFCLHLLREEIHRLGYTKEFTLYNEHDIRRILNAISRDILNHDGEMPSLTTTSALIADASCRGLSAEEIIDPSSKWHENFARTLYARLQEAMRAYNAVDFDRLLSLAVELFEKFPDLLNIYQERFCYIMIDEYQDTNPIQFKLTSLLAEKYGNLCVVGDDDQSIYGWRGADMSNILNFGNATVIKLEQNYRSTTTILEAANAVIRCNTKRHDKQLWSQYAGGDLIDIVVAPDEAKEAEAVIGRIARLQKEKGLKWKDIAILYRSNALSRQFELALTKQHWQKGERWVQGIPYRIYGAVEFYERREVKDLLAYLRVIVNRQDQESLLRVINQPRRGIGEGSLDVLTSFNRKEKCSLWSVIKGALEGNPEHSILFEKLSDKSRGGLKKFVTIIEMAAERFNKDSLSDTLKWLIDEIDYKRAVKEEVKSDQMRAFKWENVQEFVNAAAQFETASKENAKAASLRDFVQSIPLQEDWNGAKSDSHEEDKVHLLTFHSSKGLEFPVCFLVGIEEGVIPHAKSMLQTGIEEERRLMYVAITRAMKNLTISMSKTRMRMGKMEPCRPSCFLYEIPKGLINNVDWKIY